MMKCDQCGFENNDDANFCANCGNVLREDAIQRAMADITAAEESVQPDEQAEEVNAPEEVTVQEETVSDKTAVTKKTETSTGFILMDEEGKEQAPRSLMEELAAQTERLKETEPVQEPKKEEPVLIQEEYQWYYVDRGQSRGPFDQGLFEEMAVNGTIGPKTYIWHPGMESWMHMDETDFGRRLMSIAATAEFVTLAEPEEDPLSRLEARNEQDKKEQAREEEKKQTAAGSEWFYVHNSRSSGPYADEVMGQFIRSGLLDANTYVWKEGMDDWQHLGSTTLARYLTAAGERPDVNENSFSRQDGSYYSVPKRGTGYAPYAVRDHSVILYILLYFVTCGVFGLFWLYQTARDVDALADANNVPKGVDPVLALILDIVTCGLFKVYYFWKEAAVLGSMTGVRSNDQAILLCILGFICPVAAFAILQDQINTLVRG